MTFKSWFPTFYWLLGFWRNRFTLAGKALSLVMLATLPSLGAPDSPLLLLFGGTLSLLAAAAFFNSRHRARLQAAKMIRACATVGESAIVDIPLENTSERCAYDLQISAGNAPSIEASADEQFEMIDSGAIRTAALTLTPSRRGAFTLPPLKLTTAFPLNLVCSTWRAPLLGELLAYPRRANVTDISQTLYRHATDGDTMAASFTSGRSSDYEGSREYQPGIPVRRWDYSSWARTGQPVVREFGDDQQNSFAIAIDPTVASISRGELSAEFEALMSLGVGVCSWLLEHDRRIGAVLIGSQFVSGEAGLDGVLDLLARAQPESEDRLSDVAATIESMMLGQNGVFFLTAKWDARRRSFCQQINEVRPLQALVVSESPIEEERVSQVSASDILAGRSLEL